ncbi:MAG: spore germination protein, partial [Clostridiales bacterium]|nr:spore germination protein [Clostridiales bacterium]
EAILMEATLALLQEASIRLPRVVGQTVSIVGGLVVGQAAVQAGIVGPIMVIITALTAIGSFTTSDYSLGLATRAVRIPFMILASTLGFFGVSMGMLLLLIYIADLESFGIRYIRPLSPYRSNDLRQTLIRSKDSSVERPVFLNPQDRQKQSRVKRGGGDEK